MRLAMRLSGNFIEITIVANIALTSRLMYKP